MLIQIGYRLVLWLSFFLIPLYLLYRSKKQTVYRYHWLERIGFYSRTTSSSSPTLWVHAVSVGETRAAKALIDQLMVRYPNYRILLTQMTPTGRHTAATLFPSQNVTTVYLPYDYPSALRRFLHHFQPKLGLLLETEIWPNLIHECTNHHVPLLLVNARLSEKSLKGYLKIKPLIAPAMKRLTAILAQSKADALRLEQLGGENIHISGNIKFDQTPNPDKIAQGLNWKKNLQRPTLLMASSREGEETLLLEYLSTHPLPKNILLLLVPRHPQRFDAIVELIKKYRFSFIRRTEWSGETVPTSVQILLGDSLGEMESYYSCADIALIGGSFKPFGGHNLIEAALCNTPTIVGPHMFNFTQATEEAVKMGACRQVPDLQTAVKEAIHYFNHPQDQSNLCQANQRFISTHQGAVSSILAALPRLD